MAYNSEKDVFVEKKLTFIWLIALTGVAAFSFLRNLKGVGEDLKQKKQCDEQNVQNGISSI